MSFSKIIGIDLGTTNTCMSILQSGIPKIIPNLLKNPTTPSFVAYEGNKVVIGDLAKEKQTYIPDKTIFASKRLIGRKYDDVLIKDYVKSLPYKTYSHKNGDIWIKVGKKLISPVQIASDILKYMKDCAEKFLKTKEIKDAIITVPAYFNDSQRQATKDAGRIAGLNVLRVISEPTAAALAYGLDKKGDGVIAVYDLGGGTFDISILEVKDGIFDVKSVNGNSELGGEDIDVALMADVLKKIDDLKEKNVFLQKKFYKKDLQGLKQEVEKMKINLSHDIEYKIFLKKIIKNKDEIDDRIFLKYTRKDLEKIAYPILKKTIFPCKKAMNDAKICQDEIDHVILVGGATRMPLVRKLVKDVFKKNPNTSIDPDEAVAKGAAIQGGIIEGKMKDVVLLDVCGLSLGIETIGGLFSKIIKRNTTIPCKETSTFTTSEDNQEIVEINIYQGERPLVKNNKFLGKIKLKDLPKMGKGIPRIEVTFESDANGIFKVTARDAVTMKEQKMEISPASGLTEEEIKKIIETAEKTKKDDEIKIKCIKIKLDIEKILLNKENIKNKTHLKMLENFLDQEIFDVELAAKIIKEIIDHK